MRGFRRRVRAWVTTWLLCQFAAVSAFAPRECCEAHQPATTRAATHSGDHAAAHGGHHTGHQAAQAAAPASHKAGRAAMCSMRGPNGEPCPMHAHEDGSGKRTCIMRGTCNGPITAVVTLFLTPADPLDAYTLAADDTAAPRAGPSADSTLDFSPSVFTPPPRA